jgi:hypothetical protein
MTDSLEHYEQDDPDKTLIESVITKLQKVKQDKLVNLAEINLLPLVY